MEQLPIIASILEAPGCKFERAHLEAKDDSELEALEALAKGNVTEPAVKVNQGTPMGRPVTFAGKVTPDISKNEDNPMGKPMGRPMSLQKTG